MNTIITELNKLHLPIVRINAELDRYSETVLFRKKVDEANNVLRTVGLPGRNKMDECAELTK